MLPAAFAFIAAALALGAVSWSSWGQRMPQRACLAGVVALFMCGCVLGMVGIR